MGNKIEKIPKHRKTNFHQRYISHKKTSRHKTWTCDVDEYFKLIYKQISEFEYQNLKILEYKKNNKMQEENLFQNGNNLNQKDKELNWKEFILNYLEIGYQQGNLWIIDLYKTIFKEKFNFDKKWQNLYFWQEYEMHTKPKCLIKENKRKFYPQSDYFTYEVFSKSHNKDITSEFKIYQENIYNYMRIINEHFCDKDHPFNFIIRKFSEYFCKYVKDNLDNLINLKINNYNHFIEINHDIEENIVNQLLSFATILLKSLPLFYSKGINSGIFTQEEDEFMNLIIGLIFKQKNLYQLIINIVTLCLENKINDFKEILNNKINITPEELNIPDKFCLNNSSVSYYEDTFKNKINNLSNSEYSPYEKCIDLLKSIKFYKKPYDKLLLINKIAINLRDNVYEFYINIDKNISMKSFGIEADELINILCYIIIKAQIPELIAQLKFIKLFTSDKTRGTVIGYYYSSFEVCVEYINSLKENNENNNSLYKDCQELLNYSENKNIIET